MLFYIAIQFYYENSYQRESINEEGIYFIQAAKRQMNKILNLLSYFFKPYSKCC